MRSAKWGLVVVLWAAAAAQPAPATASNEVCASCHEQEAQLKKSRHAGVACASCHLKHEEYPHPEKKEKPACAQCHAREVEHYTRGVHSQEAKKDNAAAPGCATCHGDVHETVATRTAEARKAIPGSCGMCHDKELTEFQTSVHGKAVDANIPDAPVCTDCHGDHQILRPKNPLSSVFPTAVAETCAGCHGDLKLTQRFGLKSYTVASFQDSFHGMAAQAGQQTVASCASCHGYHHILPSTDRQSSIHPTNIARTCGACHPGAGERFAIGSVHSVDPKSQPLPVQWATLFYQLAIPGTIGLMLLHHGGDYIRKLAHLRFRRQALEASAHRWKPRPAEVRMDQWERVQHALLAVSFFVLVWTGFALRYPDEWWSRPALAWEKTWPVRGTIHRAAAAVMVAASLLHVVLLIVDQKLRRRWKGFLPVWQDFREALYGMQWALGLRRTQPFRSAHSYIEKAEYWAVVWGTAVMSITGVFLWANNWTLHYLPKWWIDFSRTIHFYEALLAFLSILVWHFYMVIFDPDIYPMDPAWLTGRSPRPRPPDSDPHHD